MYTPIFGILFIAWIYSWVNDRMDRVPNALDSVPIIVVGYGLGVGLERSIDRWTGKDERDAAAMHAAEEARLKREWDRMKEVERKAKERGW